jgi:assimilatory nitrate reductase catalytic subunit
MAARLAAVGRAGGRGAPLPALARQDRGQAGPGPGFKVVCQCFGITETQIETALAKGEKLACGTNCGSCLPEVRTIAERVAAKPGTMAA